MKCKCQTPFLSCKNARPRIVGNYCQLDLEPTEPTEIGRLRYGQRFSFPNTPYAINTVIGAMDDRIQYKREDGWKRSEFNLSRVVNKLV